MIKVWKKFRDEYKVKLPDIVREISLKELPGVLEVTFGKKNRGQIILKH